MSYNEQMKREYNHIVGKIEHELNSVIIMAANALGFVVLISFVCMGAVYDDGIMEYLLSTVLLFALFFAVMFAAKLTAMHFIRIKVRECLIEEGSAEISERAHGRDIVLREKSSISA